MKMTEFLKLLIQFNSLLGTIVEILFNFVIVNFNLIQLKELNCNLKGIPNLILNSALPCFNVKLIQVDNKLQKQTQGLF